jgi:putative tryptophan/tyrosine transport system substrate-binding protein
MRRREFIGLAGTAVTWPLAARAQQTERMRYVGVVMVNSESDPEGRVRVGAFRDNLQRLGWIEGRNIRMEYRWGAGDPDRAGAHAVELVGSAADAILCNGTPATAALQRATRNIPVVFVVVTDPVGAGLVQSQARPGGNITGFSTFEPEIGGKWLGLLKEVAPGLRRVAGILDPAFKSFAGVWHEVERLAPGAGVQVTSVVLRTASDDLDAPIAAFAQPPGGGLIVLPTAINNISRKRIFSLAARHRLPAVYPFRHYAADGGLMSYGFDTPDLFRRAASYIDRILKGKKPADLPVQAPTKYELVFNLKTAKALGVTVSPTLLARADEVIE